MSILDLSVVNWLAVGACVLLMLALRARTIWFGPKTLYPTWWRMLGIEKDDPPKPTALTVTLVIVASVLQAVFLALLVNAIGGIDGPPSLATGGLVGLFLWLGSVGTAGLVDKVFSGQYRAWVLEAGSHLALYMACGVILGAWR